ncbi:MAG: RNA 2',3'-cyclic phosphodiesterase [Candidatus Zixiibacteriota bacterium]
MRLFIAIPFDHKVESFLGKIIGDLKESTARVKWVDPHNIHLTLKFLGETDEKLVPKISESLEKIALCYQPMTGIIDIVGAFPNPNKARVVWAGMSKSIEPLVALADEIDRAMSEFGFEKETRKFKSHLTLGRPKDPRNVGNLPQLLQNYRLEPLETNYDTIVLFKSQLTPQGPIYTRLFETKLKSHEIFS